MSLSENTKYRLGIAVTDFNVGNEIADRLLSSTPADAAAAQALLDSFDHSSSMNSSISERLFIALAGSGAQGNEISAKLNAMINVLRAQANGNEVPAVAASASLNLTADIALTSVATGSARNTNTFTLQVLAAAANPTNTILANFTGTAAAIVCTITPNDGTNNGAVAVDLTTAELRELINSGAVVGKSVTVTDASALRNDQTATGGGAQNLADGGEGDGVVATFSGGANASDGDLAPAKLAMGSSHMSASAYESLIGALTLESAALEFKNAYNAMIDYVQAIA